MRWGSPLLAGALAATLLAGCVHSRDKGLVLLEEGSLAPPEGAWDAAPPRPPGSPPRPTPILAPVRAPMDADGWDVAPPKGAARPAEDEPRPAAPPAVRTSAAPAAHRALGEGADLAQLARETCLRCETVVEAEKATLYVPPALAAEARVEGHVLTLRRLTIRATRLKLVARTDGLPDVSITARGDVSFRSDRPASVIDERGLKTLLVRNDGFTPLR